MKIIQFVFLFLLFFVMLFITACANGGGNQPPDRPPDPPINPPTSPTASILASAASIIQGDSVILNWTSTNATSCRALDSWSGDKALTGSETITPQATRPLTSGFTCENSAGWVSVSVTVNGTAAQAPTIKI